MLCWGVAQRGVGELGERQPAGGRGGDRGGQTESGWQLGRRWPWRDPEHLDCRELPLGFPWRQEGLSLC